MSLSIAGALGLGAGLSAVNSGLSWLSGSLSADKQAELQKDLFDYQWEKAQSPQAQVKNLATAGINPASVFGSGSPDVVGGAMPSVSAPPFSFSAGVDTLRELTGAEKDVADIKKIGVDTTKVENEIEGVKLSNEMQQFQNQITKEYGIPKAAKELALAAEQVKLAQQQGDLNEIDKAIKKWTEAKEHAISQAEQNKRDILKQELENTAKRLELENKEISARVNASNAAADASRAAAAHSRALALTENEMRDIRIEAGRIANSMQDNELNYNVATFGSRVDAIKNQVTSYELDNVLKQIEAQDKAAYTTLQRLFYGKGDVKGADAKRALHLFTEIVSR